jgi:ubiquinone/menaquinone biosynthesis C-methylase UbiE
MSFFENTRKPVGFGGKIMVAMMNLGHSPVARWGLRFLELAPDARVLDCGCGGGANIKRLLKKCPQGIVRGVDYSAVSVEKARNLNRTAIQKGRCAVWQGSVERIIFAKDWFDAVTAFETVYFWSDLPQCLREVRRVLKPGGILCGCFYVAGECKQSDWFVRHVYERTGFFTPPYETVSGLKARLEGMYTDVDRGNLKSMAWFVCRKAE